MSEKRGEEQGREVAQPEPCVVGHEEGSAGAPVVICPRCKRQAKGWDLKRPDVCSPDYWVSCMREPQRVLAIAQQPPRRLEKREVEG